MSTRDRDVIRSQQGQSELRQLLADWRTGRDVGKHFTAIKHLPARQAQYAALPEALDPRVGELLRGRGFQSLYSHQARAVEAALGGRHTVVVTPTASGKSLCYNLPVIDSLYKGHSALYLFPTKALSQDQSAELNQLLKLAPGRDPMWEGQVYDGDTDPDVRRRVRRNGRLVLTNPDMLHAAILPHHDKWARFFKGLKYIVVDELHTYRGVFGSHVANVLWRLRRICRHYGTDPIFLATSATIANPRELAKELVGGEVELIDESGAPQAERYVCFLNPPIVDADKMRRQSPLRLASRIATKTLKRDCPTIVFARSRQSVEVMVNRLKRRLAADRDRPGLADRVASYRGGYLPGLRRSIESGLREGHVRGVVTTNALELGVDIGSLDVCVLAGYPGTIASTWQQIGRAGRSGGVSVAIVIAGDNPIDQFIIQNPDYFFGQSPEAARVDPQNLLIAVEHLKCACYELEWRAGEAYGGLSPADTDEALDFMARAMGVVQRSGERWTWTSRTYPANQVSLRSTASENFVVIDTGSRERNVLAEVDFESAHLTLYPNAVYQISGEPYRVVRLDYDERRAYVERSDDGYYTTAMHYAATHVLDVFKERDAPRTSIGFGEVRVTQRFVGFKKIKFGTGENIGYGELNLPELDLHTMAYWLQLKADDFKDRVPSSLVADQWVRLVEGVGEVLKTTASLKMMCDWRDLELCIGSVANDQWWSQGLGGLTVRDASGEEQDFEAGQIAPSLYEPHIYLYDRYPGGVGLGEGLFDEHETFMGMARDLVRSCPCEAGCPSCVGPPGESAAPIKASVATILEVLSQRETSALR